MAASVSPPRPGPDEGYAEGSEHDGSIPMDMEEAEDDGTLRQHHSRLYPDLFALRDEDRTKVFYELLAALTVEQKQDLLTGALQAMPTSSIARVVQDLHPRLHLNPINILPSELMEMILQQLSPIDAIRCSMASHRWRRTSLDSQLWRRLYFREGWMANFEAIDALREEGRRVSLTPSQRRKHETSLSDTNTRKRQREAHQSNAQWSVESNAAQTTSERNFPSEIDHNGMEGMEESLAEEDSSELTGEGVRLSEARLREHQITLESMHLDPPLVPSLLHGTSDRRVPDWLYLYKQRRRLETNWDKNRCVTFQLPRVECQHEAHEECVYTIQFSGNHLVSGSRDRSIKVWDLNTQRCIRTLAGQHDQSVLCLQFDVTDDIIISGGSDSYVVVWKLSTGEVIKKMTTAHTESVLNLRFDDRYLITCSKDKTIKIWNRYAIMSNDPIVPEQKRRELSSEPPRELEPYTLLSELTGHGAAVNAIQIYGDTVVSASGDRSIRMWDIQTGLCIKDFSGHVKGIACVQYDGRRIISGSSDNTVRIFDAQTQAEVACLTGHQNLVRTVQARFGDKTISDQELESLARELQDQWARRVDTMAHDSVMTRSRYGLDTFHDVRSLNAKIPQGGGGSRWSRLVSGSYDETIIIWKKDTDGKWIAHRRMHQDEILNNPRNRPRAHRLGPQAHTLAAQQFFDQQLRNHLGIPAQAQAQGQAPPAAAAGPAGITAAATGPAQQPPPHQQPRPGAPQGPPIQPGPRGLPVAAQPPQRAPRIQPAQPPQPAGNAPQAAAGGAPPFPAVPPVRHARRGPEDGNSVFKLQFDCRRIVCCSKNRIIVGWDFANGDKDLIEASKYFVETD